MKSKATTPSIPAVFAFKAHFCKPLFLQAVLMTASPHANVRHAAGTLNG